MASPIPNRPQGTSTELPNRAKRHIWPEGAPRCRLDQAVRTLVEGASWSRIRDWIVRGKVRVDQVVVVDASHEVRPGQSIVIDPHGHRPATVALDPSRIVHVDSQVVVVDKPPMLSTVAYDTNDAPALDTLTRQALASLSRRPVPTLHVVHRIDKETSGLVVFARTLSALRHLKQQFRFHTISRAYLALVHGQATSVTYRSRLLADRGDGRRGSTPSMTLGQEAITHVRLLASFAHASFIECTLETGRTHQIRIHLAEDGHPLLGERVYGRQPLVGPPAPRVMLHAARLGFVHPSSEQEVCFESPLHGDFQVVLEALRQGSTDHAPPFGLGTSEVDSGPTTSTSQRDAHTSRPLSHHHPSLHHPSLEHSTNPNPHASTKRQKAGLNRRHRRR